MPQLDLSTWPPQLVWLAITFIALYFVIARVAIPRTGGAIAMRKSTIDSNLLDAQKMKDKADEAVKAYEARLAEARAKADAIAHENYTALAAELAAGRAKLDVSLIAMISDAEKRVGNAKARALADVQSVAAEIATSIVGELTGASLSQATVAEAVAKVQKQG